MANGTLSKTELAALDLLIAQMEEEQASLDAAVEVQFIRNIARVTARVTRVAIRVTPVATQFIGRSASVAGADLSSLGSTANALPAGVTLDDLIALRNELVAGGGQTSAGQQGGQSSSAQMSGR